MAKFIEELWDAVTHKGPSYETCQVIHLPYRGDSVETWLKAQRDGHGKFSDSWFLLDRVLDDYRLHCDTQTYLGDHVCEGGCEPDCE